MGESSIRGAAVAVVIGVLVADGRASVGVALGTRVADGGRLVGDAVGTGWVAVGGVHHDYGIVSTGGTRVLVGAGVDVMVGRCSAMSIRVAVGGYRSRHGSGIGGFRTGLGRAGRGSRGLGVGGSAPWLSRSAWPVWACWWPRVAALFAWAKARLTVSVGLGLVAVGDGGTGVLVGSAVA